MGVYETYHRYCISVELKWFEKKVCRPRVTMTSGTGVVPASYKYFRYDERTASRPGNSVLSTN